MKIAVTGASGFVGGHVARRLVREGHEVLAYGRRPASDAHNLDGAAYQPWDLTSGPLVEAPSVDAVVHCAGAVRDWGPPREFYAVNLGGTRAALRSFAGASRFVHISTSSVYDVRLPHHLVREDAPLPALGRYLNPYARTKRLAEQAVRASGRPATILRPHAIYGVGDTTLLPRLLRARRFGRLLAVGDGRNRVSLTHVENLTDAVVRALDPAAPSGAFNVCDAETPAVDQVLRTFLGAFGFPDRIVHLPERPAWMLGMALEGGFALAHSPWPPLLSRYVVALLSHECTLDISRARQQLGYHPRRQFGEGFAEIAEAWAGEQWRR